MYSRSPAYYRKQYATPTRNGPRLCNQCQASLSCAQLAYCADCCYCKSCSARRCSSRVQLLAANDRLPNTPDENDQPLFGLNDLYASEEELDRALDQLEESQKSLSRELDALITHHNRKRKLKRSDALSGPQAKKIREFLDANLPLPPVDAEAVKSELARSGCATGDCKCPEGTHPPSSL